MKPRELAMKFVDAFCSGEVPSLKPLLAPDLRFRGPLFQFDSRDAYLATLLADPPVPCSYRVLSVTAADDAIAVFYDYEKPSKTITIAQLFKVRSDQISEILLVFDGRSFT